MIKPRWAQILADMAADPKAGHPLKIGVFSSNDIHARDCRTFDVEIGVMDEVSLMRLVGTSNADQIGPFCPGHLFLLGFNGEHWPIPGVWHARIAVSETPVWIDSYYSLTDFSVIPDPL